jgi:PAS domain S-box-containing protein
VAVHAGDGRIIEGASLPYTADLYRLLSERSRDIMVFFGLDRRIMEANRAAVEAYGYSRDELIGIDFAELRAPETRGDLADRIAAVQKGPISFETVHRRKDGTRFPAEVSWSFDRVRDRAVILRIVRDITERRQAEAALRDSEARLRGFYNTAPTFMGITELGEDDILHVYDNAATCRFLGVEPEATAGKWALADLRREPAGVRLWARRFLESERTGAAQHFEHRHQGQHATRWLSVAVCPIGIGPTGRTRFCYVAEDISERKRAEEALTDTAVQLAVERERLAIALRTGRLGVYEWRIAEQAVWWAQETYLLYGVDPETFAPTVQSLLTLVHPEDREELSRKTEASLASREIFEHEYRIVRPDGAVRWIVNRSQVGLDAAGGVERVTGVAADITERKRYEEQIRLLLREVSHRAKNMLSVIQAIARQTAAATPDAFIESFQQRIRSLAACQDLLVENEWKAVSLHDLVRSQLEHFGSSIESRVAIHGPTARVSAAASQTLAMAVHELATNAAKYGALSTPAGRVEIGWGLRDGDRGATRFEMSWVEREGPPAAPPSRHGFGSTVIDRLARQSLNGEVTLDYASGGLKWRLVCPADSVVDCGSFAAAADSAWA